MYLIYQRSSQDRLGLTSIPSHHTAHAAPEGSNQSGYESGCRVTLDPISLIDTMVHEYELTENAARAARQHVSSYRDARMTHSIEP